MMFIILFTDRFNSIETHNLLICFLPKYNYILGQTWSAQWCENKHKQGTRICIVKKLCCKKTLIRINRAYIFFILKKSSFLRYLNILNYYLFKSNNLVPNN